MLKMYLNIIFFVILVISTSSLGDKINITLIYSSADEQSLNFLKTEWTLKPIDVFEKYINWDLELYTPYTAKPNENGSRDYSFKCDHGEQEVLGNKYHECAKKYYFYKNDELINFTKCYAKNTAVLSADTVKLPDLGLCTNDDNQRNYLKTCVEGRDVINSLVNSTSNIKKLKIEMKMPILFVNGKRFDWNGKFNEFEKNMCQNISSINNLTDICNGAISNIFINIALLLSMLMFHKVMSY
ncbi:PREDICTED: uncharacterized protein LOC108566377 [Nicrophorus vespilloides]|uniref:Uncharacterized protein LOC108566377 n=1 Tax=Nicrophorus vespilloides TaxID=110193 RepID=A0ABM1N4G6_NICVS|nr:PREDICTED: uncharacterized protein LOC108566377 [Nicrophorus vespilloides]